MNNYKLLFSFMAGLVLVGCDSKIDAVNQKMAEIRNEPALPIEDTPNIVVDENGLFLLDSLGRNIIAQEL